MEKKIIKEFFGKDVSSIIYKYIWAKCYICNEYKDEYYIRELYNETFLCNGCILTHSLSIYVCGNCLGEYVLQKNTLCRLCFGECRIYCEVCLSNENKML